MTHAKTLSKGSIARRRWLAAGVALVVATATGAAEPRADWTSHAAPSGDGERYLLREGSKADDLIGTIHQSGARFYFQLRDEDRRLVVLENLALQRMLQAGEDWLETPLWKIDGRITEFQEENYVLISSPMLAD